MSRSFNRYLPRLIFKRPYTVLGSIVAAGAGAWLFRRWVAGGVCKSQAQLVDKAVIITGANTGIGLETAVDLAQRNARVILACRSVERGEKAAVEVRKRSGNDNVVFRQLDLASLDSVRKFSEKVLEEEPRIDILINNAGVSHPELPRTADGFEGHIGVNHLGHFLLTNLLLDRLKGAPSARIVNVGSLAYEMTKEFDFETFTNKAIVRSKGMKNEAYSQSKLATVLFTVALSNRLKDTKVTTNACHPGVVYTSMAEYSFKVYPKILRPLLHLTMVVCLKTPQQGAQTSIYLAVAEKVEGVTGKYFSDCKEKKVTPAVTEEAAERLWNLSCKMVDIADSPNYSMTS